MSEHQIGFLLIQKALIDIKHNVTIVPKNEACEVDKDSLKGWGRATGADQFSENICTFLSLNIQIYQLLAFTNQRPGFIPPHEHLI